MARGDIQTAERQLIVNGDDFGLSPAVNAGMVELARLGTLTSASLLVTMPGAEESLALARSAGLDVGVHLNICAGRPLSPPDRVPTLLDRTGRFPSAGAVARRYLTGRLRLEEVEREWSTQIERVLAAGLRPSHLDSHCHLHLYPRLWALIHRLARRYGIRGVRGAVAGFILQPPGLPAARLTLGRTRSRPDLYHPDHWSVLTVQGRARSSVPLDTLLRALLPGVTELICHPGHVDDALRTRDPLSDPREDEWRLLARPHFRDALRRGGIGLTSWKVASDGGRPNGTTLPNA